MFDESLIKDQSKLSLALRYSKEWCLWAIHGFKYRSQEEISEIWEQQCKPCPYRNNYGEDDSRCEICGCPVNNRIAQDNKIAYVSTHCPLPKEQRKWTAVGWLQKLIVGKLKGSNNP